MGTRGQPIGLWLGEGLPMNTCRQSALSAVEYSDLLFILRLREVNYVKNPEVVR